ncbi:MAG: hypothetical protein AB7O24_18755 [Kofleriaceae bacterium]
MSYRSWSSAAVAAALVTASAIGHADTVTPSAAPAAIAAPTSTAVVIPATNAQAALGFAPGSVQPRADDLDVKSPGVAKALSLGTTAAGFAVMIAPLFADWSRDTNNGVVGVGLAMTLVGPSTGHLYAGEIKRGLIMSALRAGTMGLTLYAGHHADFSDRECIYCNPDDYPADSETTKEKLANVTTVVSFAATAVLAIVDMVDAPKAARRANKRAAAERTLTIVPHAKPDGTAGLAVVGTF